MMIDNKDDWSDRRYDLSFKAISHMIKVRPPQENTFGHLMERLAMAVLSSIAGNQVIFMLQSNQNQKTAPNHAHGPLSIIHNNIAKTYRATEYRIILFGGMVITDHLSNLLRWDLTEYQKGGWVGLLSYLINRPLDQLQFAKREILLNEKKTISRLQALRVVLRHDGWKGLYRHQNILAPSSAVLHRSIYFGLYHRLCKIQPSSSGYVQYIFFPLLASVGASLGSCMIDKLRTTYLMVHHLRHTAVARRGKIIQEESVTKVVLGMMIKGEIQFKIADARAVIVVVVKNWILLGMFQYGQGYGGQAFMKIMNNKHGEQAQ